MLCLGYFLIFSPLPHPFSAGSMEDVDSILQKCVQCQETVSLYKLVLKSIQESLKSDKSKDFMKEASNLSNGAFLMKHECFYGYYH